MRDPGNEAAKVRTNAKAFGYQITRASRYFHSHRLIIFDRKNQPFPLAQSIKLHVSTLFFYPCLIPCHRCEKSVRESRNSRYFYHATWQRLKRWIGARGYMSSRNLVNPGNEVGRHGGASCYKNGKIVLFCRWLLANGSQRNMGAKVCCLSICKRSNLAVDGKRQET